MDEHFLHLKETLLARAETLTARLAEPNSHDTGELSHYDNHPADTATASFEYDRDAVLHKQVEDELHEVRRALAKFADGTYGICEKTGEMIPYERLEAYPTARTVAAYRSKANHVVPQVGTLTNNYFAEDREFDAYERVSHFNDRRETEEEGAEIGERLATGMTGFHGSERVVDESRDNARTYPEPD
ncbi:TraR/DksA C4-type zinc finger protein [Shouchella lonarensis]|uniref:Transcriptional regulator, TraR/DksA family n=1 Tax=Shouchella lonarensis TaxID=1464122 RepID=A0A1G6L4Y3_9BACI|nr:TraR/DksA C4-type zinc finger protein [Shouchella lonarensis]SDC38372.1 transcriptional regulator, TraR/DksA family [Shouchella lonarensis]